MNFDIVLDNMLYDRFIYDSMEIVVLNGLELTKEDLQDNLIFAKIVRSAERNEIVPIDEDDFDDILEYYLTLKSVFMKQEQKEGEDV